MKIFFVFVALLLPMAAYAAELPEYDTAAHCKMVADTIGGSYVIEKSCIEMEGIARAALAKMDIEPRILAHCDMVAKVAGGSYEILQACIDEEMEAKQGLRK